MPNTPSHVGRPQTVEALGQTWTLARWDRRVWAEFLEWAKTKLPEPRKTAAEFLAMLPEGPDRQAVAETIVTKALDESTSHLSVGSPKVTQLLTSIEGGVYLLYLLLKRNHPEATEDTAYDLFTAVGPDVAQDLMGKCSGAAPAGKGDGPGS